MKKLFYLLTAGMLLLSATVRAQKANIDSLKLVAQISQDQLDLGKLQNMVDQKTTNKQEAATNAQNSAGSNATAAQKLNDDPTNKTLANNASDKAGQAKSDAKKSRKESGRLDDLNKSILELKMKIADEQNKLRVYTTPTAYVAPVSVPTPVIVDTTQHP
jgi:hypothetical protein